MASSGEKTILLIILIIVILFLFLRFVPVLFMSLGFPLEGNIIGYRWFPGLVPLLPLMLLILIGLVLVFWVYRDAERRGMNGVLWALLVLVGNFIGLIIYLIVRNEEFPRRAVAEPIQSCPSCGKAASQSFAFCPHCGTRLKSVCPSCDKPVSSDWKVCPHCGQKLGEEK